MGVYIKRMEMPKKCGCCFAAFPDGVGHSCCLIKSYPSIDNQKGRRSDCPLVPVPEHGRLIDADALKDKWTHNDLDLFSQGWGWLRDLNQAPTIIQAEEEMK